MKDIAFYETYINTNIETMVLWEVNNNTYVSRNVKTRVRIARTKRGFEKVRYRTL